MGKRSQKNKNEDNNKIKTRNQSKCNVNHLYSKTFIHFFINYFLTNKKNYY